MVMSILPLPREALAFYKSLYDCCTPPGHSDAYMVANLDAYKSGQVAMQMNWFAFFPGIAKDESVGGDKSGFFVNPSQKVAASTLGGQGISVVSYSDKKDEALQYIKWFATPEVQKEMVVVGRLFLPQFRAERSELPEFATFCRGFPQGNGRRQGLLAGTDLCGALAIHAEASS